MKYILGLALRNVRRNRRRSLLAIISVALAVAFIVAMQGMVGGFMGSMVKNYTKNETGHVRITTKEFEEKSRFHPVTENLDNPEQIRNTVRTHPQLNEQVRLVTERISFGVVLNRKGKSKTALALAGDPAIEKDLLMLQKSLLPGGRYIQGKRETIMGKRIAEALGYSVGDTVKVMTQGSDYALHLRKFAVVGIFETGLKMMDDAMFQIPLSDAKRLLRMGDEGQQVVVMLHDHSEADKAAAAIRDALGNDQSLAVRSWLEGEYGQMVTMASSVYQIFYLALACFGAFIIGNIMMMVVLERRHEIGILKSMGLSRLKTMTLFVAEGTALGLVGSVAGTIIGALICVYFHINPLSYFADMMETVTLPMDSSIRFTLEPGGWLQALGLGTGVSALLSLTPSWRASRMNPVDAIKSI